MGKRGEGWFLLQLALFAVILAAPGLAHFPFPAWLRGVGLALAAGGAVLGIAGGQALGQSLSPFPKPLENGNLVTSGVYGVVRHPIYSGLVVATLGWGLLTNTLLGIGMAAVILLFFDIKAGREERWLMQKYSGYDAYRQRVKKLIPWVY